MIFFRKNMSCDICGKFNKTDNDLKMHKVTDDMIEEEVEINTARKFFLLNKLPNLNKKPLSLN